MVRTYTGRIAKELWDLRRQHKEQLTKALNGLQITDVEIDKLYTRKLRNINLLDEFKFGGNK